MKQLFIILLLLISVSTYSQVSNTIKVETPTGQVNIINANNKEITVKKVKSYTVLEDNKVTTVEVYQEVKPPAVNTDILPKNPSKAKTSKKKEE